MTNNTTYYQATNEQSTKYALTLKGLFFLTIIAISFSSCSEKQSVVESIESENLTATQVDSILNIFQFEYQKPIIIDSTDLILIPISTELLDVRKSYSRDGYYVDEFPRYWNVLFYNKKSDSTRLLTKGKMRISEINIENSEYDEENKIINGKILYLISNVDYNNDGKLKANDPDFLFVSEIDGTKLIKVSPDNEHLKYYSVIPNTKQVILKTVRDTNKDLKFDRYDDVIWYIATLNENVWETRELVDAGQRDLIKQMYFEQWLQKKETKTHK